MISTRAYLNVAGSSVTPASCESSYNSTSSNVKMFLLVKLTFIDWLLIGLDIALSLLHQPAKE